MRVVQTFALVICLLILSAIALSQQTLVQEFPEGAIDWSNMTMNAQGIGIPNPELSPARQRVSAVISAREDATDKLLSIFKNLNFDSEAKINDILSASEIASNQVENSILEIKTISMPCLMADSSILIDAEYVLKGKIINAILAPTGARFAELAAASQSRAPESLYTGLIVDCRERSIAYAIAPKILDENGQEIYGLGLADRKPALKLGLIQYVTNENDALLRVGEKPITVRGLSVSGKAGCDIVISESDASLLISFRDNLDFLNQCRVAFLVNQEL
ncbi:MAG: hypothetical protein GY839_10185 [candidate division Zixibacteria bacterium]|nr:hypothetical protein [candidate division Zixibacteria bacterium]